MSAFQDAIQRGDRSSQPAAGDVVVGTLYFVTDEGVTERSNGTSWESFSGSGLSTPVAIDEGGTGATTAQGAFDALSPATTKGDLIVSDGSNNVALGVGSDGQVLVADSNATEGVKWDTIAGTGDVVGPASSVDGEVALFNGTTGKLLKSATGTGVAKLASGVLSAGQVDLTSEVTGALPTANLAAAAKTRSIVAQFSGGGSAIQSGQQAMLYIPVACTITAATLIADQAGDLVVDIWVDSLANFPPTDADSITSATPPTLSSAQTSQDTTLTGWTTSIAAGSTVIFNVDSAATVEAAALMLTVTV